MVLILLLCPAGFSHSKQPAHAPFYSAVNSSMLSLDVLSNLREGLGLRGVALTK